MRKYTEEAIKEEMTGIHQVDLQNRLKKLYQEREKIKNKKDKARESNKELEEILIQEENINLSIRVYEKKLPLRVVERARRSGGVYKTPEEISSSVKKEESISNEEIEK